MIREGEEKKGDLWKNFSLCLVTDDVQVKAIGFRITQKSAGAPLLQYRRQRNVIMAIGRMNLYACKRRTRKASRISLLD